MNTEADQKAAWAIQYALARREEDSKTVLREMTRSERIELFEILSALVYWISEINSEPAGDGTLRVSKQ